MTEYAIARIRDAIVTGILPFGAKVSELSLASTLGISKTPVREALLRLQAEGLIEIVPYSGTYVCRITPTDIQDLSQLRAALEVRAMHLAMERNAADVCATLRANTEAMHEALAREDYDRGRSLDTAFYAAIIGASGNRYIVDSYALIASKLDALRHRLGGIRLAVSIADHAGIVDATARGDGGLAATRLERHALGSITLYQDLLSDARPGSATR